MPSAAANVEVLKQVYERWHDTKAGSADEFFEILDDHILWGSIPRGKAPMEFAKQYNSKTALRAYFDTLTSEWSMIHYTMDQYIADGDMVVARGSCSWTNKKTGKTVETPKVDVWRFKGGKAVEFYEYFDTAAAMAAAT
ncbi:MAG: hypothetical protein A4S14_06690 [Proteobacteria bacterium SG_bin9]|nr:MAG: hypothetical protein A4S14_06690 [Proteobacteria bacterium SG_bin9]